MSERAVLGACPRDGNEWDAQCGRCGSSLMFDTCEVCGGEGVADHDCGDDLCSCAEPELNVACAHCEDGAIPVCLSSEEWCRDNPLPGREDTERGTPEWFSTEKP